MGKAIVYCGECGKSLHEEDFEKGKAHTLESGPFCVACRPLAAPPQGGALLKGSSSRLKAIPPAAKPSSTTRIPKPPPTTRRTMAPTGPPKGLIVGGILAATVLVAVMVAILASGGRKPIPVPPLPHVPVSRAPPPEPKAQAGNPESEKVEREMRAQRERDGAARLDQFIGQIQGLLKDVSNLPRRREEVEGMLAAAGKIAGARQAEVEALRTEFARKLQEAEFEVLKCRFLDAWRVGLLDDARALREEVAARCGPEAATKLDEAGRASPHGLVGWWKLDENAGTAAADASGNGNDGKLVDGAAWAEGRVGASVAFDGKKSGVVCGAKNLPVANAPQTFACWVWYPSIPDRSDMQSFLTLTNEQEKSGIQVGICKDRLRAWAYGGKVFLAECRLPPARVWHHVAYTFDGSTHRLYVDGFPQASTTAAPQTAVPTRLELGRWWGTWDDKDWYEVLNGRMDEVRLYTRALSQEEIGRLVAAAGTPR